MQRADLLLYSSCRRFRIPCTLVIVDNVMYSEINIQSHRELARFILNDEQKRFRKQVVIIFVNVKITLFYGCKERKRIWKGPFPDSLTTLNHEYILTEKQSVFVFFSGFIRKFMRVVFIPWSAFRYANHSRP